MPKKSMKQIESDDKKVLQQLIEDSRQSPNEIAKKLGFSRQKVWRCIKKMEENHTIWGYQAIVDYNKLNVKSYILLIKRSATPLREQVEKLLKPILQKKGEKLGIHVYGSNYLHGRYDWMLLFTADEVKNVKKFCDVVLNEYSNVISEIELLEDLFPVQKGGLPNPEMEKLKEFFSVA